MKKIINSIVILGATLLVGCNDLDQSPYESFAEKDAFKDVNDAQAWVDGMYAKLRVNIRGSIIEAPEYQADLVNATIFVGNYIDLHRWDNFRVDEGNVEGIWRKSYEAIANINKGIIGFDKIPQQNEIKHFRGELHLARALYYTNMATLFCKAYDASTAQTDLGLPIAVTESLKDFPQRSSLEETYQYILNDIAKAKEFLSGKANEVGADTFTPDAAKALEARVLLYIQKWQQAYEVASSLVDASTYPLANTAADLQKIWYEDDLAESITQLYATKVSAEQPSQMNFIGRFEINGVPYEFFSPPVIPTKTFVELYDNADYRKDIYIPEKKVEFFSGGGQEIRNVNVIHKYPGNPALKIGTTLSYAHKPKVFRIAEQYVIAAEAAYNNNDAINARKYLNALREKRGLTAYTGTDLLQEIKNERTRELAFEGFRLFDLKRWKQDVVRGVPQFSSELILNDIPTQLHQLNRSYTDYKMVWPILASDAEASNGVLKQNPGW